MPGRRRPDDSHDDAEIRLDHRRQHAEHRRHDPHQGRRLSAGVRRQRQFADAWPGPTSAIRGATSRASTAARRRPCSSAWSGFGVPGPDVHDPATGFPGDVSKATVLRIELAIPRQAAGDQSETVVANGFAQRADQDKFLFGPTGLALAADGTLYVSDALDNRIVAIPDAATRTTSAGTGTTVTQGGLLQRPLALVMTPAGHILVVQRQERPGGGDRPGHRQADLRAVGRCQPGAVAAGQRRPVRHRDEAGRRRASTTSRTT